MSNISSNSLFHFTPKIEFLISILKNDFIPRYSWEEIDLISGQNESRIESGLPMVCFCDISLSQIDNHIEVYGNYGIGMTKEWGIKNKMNPIIYVVNDSKIGESISGLADTVQESIGRIKEKISTTLADHFFDLSYYLKPYIGDFIRQEKVYRDYKYYNEREWRYTPNLNMNSNAEMSIGRADFSDNNLVNRENEKLKKLALKFTPNDIKYIFVKNQNDIHPIIQQLRDIKETNYTPEEIDILTSKILTIEQINDDF